MHMEIYSIYLTLYLEILPRNYQKRMNFKRQELVYCIELTKCVYRLELPGGNIAGKQTSYKYIGIPQCHGNHEDETKKAEISSTTKR